MDAGEILRRSSAAVERRLSEALAACDGAPRRLMEAIGYSLLGGGKRLRPALVIESWRACAGAAALSRELAVASGPAGMVGGQVLDMEGEGKPLSLAELQDLHRRKTGALIRASCRMGAIAAGAAEAKLDAVTVYGQHAGLAFQIVDDLLDVSCTPQQLGKASNKDAARGKNTYPALLGVEASRNAAAAQLDAALSAIDSFGAEADGLRALARFVVERVS